MISLSIGGTTGGTILSIGGGAPGSLLSITSSSTPSFVSVGTTSFEITSSTNLELGPPPPIAVFTITNSTNLSFAFSGLWTSNVTSAGESSVAFAGVPAGVFSITSGSSLSLITAGPGNVVISGSSTFLTEPNQRGSLLSFGTSTASFSSSYLSRFNPSSVLPGIILDGSNLIIPIASLPGLSSEEANSTSGSWIDIFQAICIADHLWEEAYTPSNSLTPDTYSSWNNRNMNAKSSKFQYGVGELNTFLKHFTVTL